MNKNAIQKFAIWARNELIAQVSQRAYQYGIDESGFGDASADTLNGRLLTAEEKSQRQELIKQIKEKGYQQVMEEVAYTWFNRFIALRFMEVNNYLPSHIRVFSDASGAFKPEILNDVLHLDLPGLDSGKVAAYIENNDTEALYRYLLLTQCNALNSALPVMLELHDGWKYYLDEAEQEPEVEAQLAKLREEYKAIKPEEIKVIDPCMGSGHILVYAFDVLMQIYTSAGWDQREAAQSILKNNLFGLDIDDRAAQLAYFAVMMKARQYDRRLLTRGIQPNIYSIRESNGIQAMTIEYFHKNDPKLKADIGRIVTEMRDAKEYGSILNITPVDFAGLYARFDEIREDINMMQMSALDELLPLVKCAELLAQKYDVVVTNPPYMGSGGMSDKLVALSKRLYPNVKSDLFSICIQKMIGLTRESGLFAYIAPQSWMFLSTQEGLRNQLLHNATLSNLIDLGINAFDSGFGTATAVFSKTNLINQRAVCLDLTVDLSLIHI